MSLDADLDRLASAGALLVALDFDGVLAPLVDDPSASRPLPESAEAVRRLAAHDTTTVVMLSGRGRDDLAAVSGFGPPVGLVGSHGAEYDDEVAARLGRTGLLTAAQAERREALLAGLRELVDAAPGSRLETKPAGAAVHVRGMDPADGAALLERVAAGWVRDGIDATPGKDVLDLAVLRTTKGAAVEVLRDQLGIDTVLFAGDDVTDETAFRVLRDGDVGIKVGDGDTAARHRVPGPPEMAGALERLAALRG
ncbi:Trehalose-6-phosphate phosphatase [Pseudonocardia sp. Ae168_Ps1]|uniref:trehalose-phosphatase n=1 Tax=unclassified Pseudonocardia TaxID=2619320 RepID=UPI00094ACA3D|nr:MULTISPECIES: trehalose-phosphatase [unclassified Pseudonocardia]OLL74676.1 Trehalose-6-phosphate phosphatase [Pseudonocardia sp. Ae150A_Ps1]OLL80656.1 Trehalose-6-phosphate phosphatase [Pseudonocardia sp. Ae168_Ps1]OLL85215.1 Trehalose-6-phosphate phosphatase [Pseudonocardia sp. Ae263_Ps1]OLL94760.1 Trehalose-6-phosphate phosphatase [Pseudonocardia sp. Ae356_Ps1]